MIFLNFFENVLLGVFLSVWNFCCHMLHLMNTNISEDRQSRCPHSSLLGSLVENRLRMSVSSREKQDANGWWAPEDPLFLQDYTLPGRFCYYNVTKTFTHCTHQYVGHQGTALLSHSITRRHVDSPRLAQVRDNERKGNAYTLLLVVRYLHPEWIPFHIRIASL